MIISEINEFNRRRTVKNDEINKNQETLGYQNEDQGLSTKINDNQQ